MAAGQKPFYIALGVVVLAGVAIIAARLGGSHPISIPANVVVTAADTSGFRGYPLGSVDAPVTITEYADFQCPHCADFAAVQWPDIKTRLINTGKVRWYYRDFPIEGDGSRVAAHAAACANDQGKFWPVEEAMFRRQTDWAVPYRTNPMPVLTEIVRNAGVDVNSWNACMKSARYAGRIQASFNDGTAVGVQGTPSFVIAGRLYTTPQANSDMIANLVDSLIAARGAAPAAAPTTPTTGGR